MKKIYLCLLVTFFYINTNFAQWSNVNIGTGQDLYSVDYYSTNDIWIGSFQQIIKSSSGGASWSIINPIKDNVGVDITPANIYDLALTSPTNAIGTGVFFMGNTECILNTTNGGINWDFASTNSIVGLPRYLNAVDVSGTRSVAVGNNGRIARSTNSGVSWTFVSSGVSSLISDVKFGTYDTVYAAGDNNIFRSVDGGSTWTNQTISGSFKSISCDKGVVYAGGPGIIYKSVDYGVNYTPIIIPFSYQGTLYAIDKDTILAAGDDGIYVSRTGGAYWEKYALPSYQQVKMFDFLNHNVGIAVGNLGYTVRTNNLSLAPKIPVSAFSIIGGLTTFCEGDSITFSNTSLTGCSYLWEINGSAFSSTYAPTLMLNSEGQQTISLIVSNSSGSDTTSIAINVLGHHINPIPALVVEDSVCSGNIVGFSVLNSQVGVNYQLRQGFLNIGLTQAGNGGVLYFSSLNPITTNTTYSIKAVKTTACFTDSLIQNQTIYIYPSIASPTMICTPANNLCGSPGFDPGITNVTFGNINNSTNFIFNNYFDYSCCKNTTVTMGNTYPISITTAYQNGEFVSVWIDYNNDGIFNTTTEVAMTGFAFPTINSSILIPTTTAFNQKLRMRVVSDIDSISANACSFYCGEIEDYAVTILPAIINPVSSFSSTSTVGCTTSIAFTNTSYNGTSYSWNFGDGSPIDTSTSPTHIYNTSGTYMVSLITCNPYGCDTTTQSETITIPQLPSSSFCTPTLSPISPLTEVTQFLVDTTYAYGGTLWESIDPNSEDQLCTDQLHLNAASTYYFKCYVNVSSYRAVNYYIDYNNDGVFDTNEYINSPQSIGWASSYGIVPTIVQIPETAVLNAPLRMRMIVFDGPLSFVIGSCPTTATGFYGLYHDYTVFIGPALPTIADFSIWGPSPCTNNPVNFLNTSLHASHYSWDYGDGFTDTTQDGSHIYTTPGTYTVKLIASNNSYTDTMIRTSYVTVLPSLPVPSLTLTGTVLSTGATASGYQWYKDDVLINGATSSSYDLGLVNGVYRLVLINSNGCETRSADYPYNPLHANFTASPTNSCGTTLVYINNTSTNATSYTIHWGDGATTSYVTGGPFHSYSPGIYTMKLVACNGTSCDSLIRTNYITVGTAASVPLISLSGGILTTSSIEPYYQWNLNGSPISGATSSSYTPLIDGDYSLTVTNSSGCSATSAIHHFYPIHPGFYTYTPMYCGSATSSILLINTSTNATSYLWDFGDGTTSIDSDPYHSFPPIGTFTVKLIACNGTECDSITQLNYITTDSTIITPIISALGDTMVCPGYSVDLVTNNVSGYTYQWKINGNYLGASDTLYTAGSTGEYVLEATTPFGCVGISNPINVSIENCVWPGDADGNYLVDNNDLLPIGLYYSQTGFPRSIISNDWQEYPATNWGILYPPYSTDIKNADCNGDGIIDDNDTLAINMNLSSVHSLTQHPLDLRATDPMFTLTSTQSIYAPGDWVDIDIWLGSSSEPVNNIYGIAFNLQFDPNLTQAGTERLSYPVGLMGAPGTNTLTIGKTDRTTGYAYGAITRKTHTNISGSGLLATFHFQIDSTISTLNTLFFTIDNYMSNDSAGTFIPLITNYHYIEIDPMPTTISSSFNGESGLSIYPNPYTNFTNINYHLYKTSNVSIEIYNSIGQKIEKFANENQQAGQHSYLFSAKAKGYEPGVYFVKMTIDGVTTTKRIIELK